MRNAVQGVMQIDPLNREGSVPYMMGLHICLGDIIRGVLSCILSLFMLLTSYGNIIYAGEDAVSSTTKVKLVQEAAVIDVTVPTSLPISIDSKGIITVADNFSIINNSAGPIEVKSISITLADYELVDWSKVDTWKAGEKKLSLEFEALGMSDCELTLTNFIIDAGDSRDMVYNAKLPLRLDDEANMPLGTVTFNVDWVDAPHSTVAFDAPGYWLNDTTFYPWDVLVNTYGFDIEADYGSSSSSSSGSSSSSSSAGGTSSSSGSGSSSSSAGSIGGGSGGAPSTSATSTPGSIISALRDQYMSGDTSGGIVVVEGSGRSTGTLVIPDSVTCIGDNAFLNCDHLRNIEIPNSVVSIGTKAFFNCTSLLNVEIPDSITSIGNSVFSHCASLEGVIIPDSVTSIGRYAFSRCASIQNVQVPDSVTSIGDYAFENINHITANSSLAGYPWGAKQNHNEIDGTCSWCASRTSDVSHTHTWVDVGSTEVHQRCENCDAVETVHTFTRDWLSNATCTSGEEWEYSCSCGYSYVKEEAPASGHNYINYTVTSPNGCITGMVGVCDRCGNYKEVSKNVNHCMDGENCIDCHNSEDNLWKEAESYAQALELIIQEHQP